MGTTPTPVNPPPVPVPTASLTANPPTVDSGRVTTLKWQTQNASSVNIDGIGDVAQSGSVDVTPTETTTYVLTAKGPGGLQQALAPVSVNPPPKPLYIIVSFPAEVGAANAALAKAMFDGYPKLVTVYTTKAPSGVDTAFGIFSA